MKRITQVIAWVFSHRPAMSHRLIALIVIAVTLFLDALCGLWLAVVEHIPAWHGVYVALADAETLGGDIQPDTAHPVTFVIGYVICLLVLPLFGASLGFFTSGLSELHIGRAVEEIKDHTESRIRHHLAKLGAGTDREA